MMSNEKWTGQYERAFDIKKLTGEGSVIDKDRGSLSAKEKRKAMLGRILTPREKQVISLRFGIGTDNALTLEEVGKSMGLTRERIRQIEQKALKKLQGHPRLQFMRDYLN
jgi:RNA polymerase sigma factor (sigma-70 family)